MKRQDQIKEMAQSNAKHMTCDKDMQVAFADALRRGAQWADESILESVQKYDMTCRGRLHNIWKLMKSRCYNPKASGFKYYGGKGIDVCDEWQSFITFAIWAIMNGYADNLTIDRVDNNKGYCPQNCRWVDLKTQANNTSRNHIIDGKTIAQHATDNSINYRTLHNRVTRSGLSVEKALIAPPYNPKEVLCFDKEGNLIREYVSSKVACACVGGSLKGRGHIDDVCRGKRKTAFGFIWKYKE